MTDPQGICFDLDGVLVDSAAVVEDVWRRWADRHGVDHSRLFPAVHGRRTVDMIAELDPSIDAAEAEAEAASFDAEEAARAGETVACAGARELLEALPAERWAVVTSGDRKLAEGRILGAGLPLPSRLVTADDVSRGKPDPEPYLLGAARLGLDPAACLAVEDSPAGVGAARAAGMPVFAVLTTHPAGDLAGADRIIDSLGDLDSLARRI